MYAGLEDWNCEERNVEKRKHDSYDERQSHVGSLLCIVQSVLYGYPSSEAAPVQVIRV